MFLDANTISSIQIYYRERMAMSRNNNGDFSSNINEIKNKKFELAIYIFLRLVVFVTMIVSFFNGNYENVFLCIFSLFLFMIPSVIQKKLNVELPTTLEVIILFFIFASLILGEMQSYYIKFQYWDTMLHTINGFLCAAVGFALVELLNRQKNVRFNLSPIYLSIVAFCFSMTVGVLWEFFECGCDMFLHTDMQKDTIVHSISSTALNKSKENTPVIIDNIREVTVNGEKLDIDGYLDIGLLDTMKDLFVNFIGAIVFSIIGYFYLKKGGNGKFARKFIPRIKT